MTDSDALPRTINKLALDVYPGLAMVAGLELGVYTALRDSTQHLDELAGALGVAPVRLRHLLYALVEAGLLELRGADRFANTAEAARFLVRDRPDYVGMQAGFHRMAWTAVMRTAESIRTGKPQARWNSMSDDDKHTYLDGLRPSSRAVARELLHTYGLDNCQSLVDVAGGSGELAIALTRDRRDVAATVLEHPDVVPVAQALVAEAGAADRVRVVASDVVEGPLEGAYDAAVVRNFIQVLSPSEAVRALRNVYGILRPGAPIYIIDLVLDDDRLGPAPAVRYGLLLVNLFDDSPVYTESEYRGFLADAGFVGFARERSARAAAQPSILRAERPR